MRKPLPLLWRSRLLRCGLALVAGGTALLGLTTLVTDASTAGEALRWLATLSFTTAQIGLALMTWAAVAHLVNAARLVSKPRH